MPRRARIVVPGIPWHIIQRGNNRLACFYTGNDQFKEEIANMIKRRVSPEKAGRTVKERVN